MMSTTSAAAGTAEDARFKFGKNWSHFLTLLDDERIAEAEKSLKERLGVADLQGKRFIDIGSGSGLFSLAARRLGATVHSFDYDTQSVACTAELKRRYYSDDPAWTVEQGSALDKDYLGRFGKFDVVYSWGVLHHTGNMWLALENVVSLVADDGLLFIALYNDQGWQSRVWTRIKYVYNKVPSLLKYGISVPIFVGLYGAIMVRDTLRGNPIKTWQVYRKRRGMSPWYDLVDWVGGYPFEVASVKEILHFYEARGFQPVNVIDVGGKLGCNEFVFRKSAAG